MHAMRNPLLLLCFTLVLYFSLTSSVRLTLREGSSLSVDKPDDILTSEDCAFSAGFYPVGENAYCFAIWFSKPSCSIHNCAVVWMANRDRPLNGRSSKLSLRKKGNLVLIDAGRTVVWATRTESPSGSSRKLLQLLDTGNLVLRDKQHIISWQSFDSPTNTLLPLQKLTRNTPLVSSRSKNNFSSGYYKLYFDNDNLLRLLFDGPKITSFYWPDPWLSSWQAGRTTYNDSRVAMLDPYGNLTSSDDFKVLTSDYGAKIQRRLIVDHDGNVRVYSQSEGEEWTVSWQAKSEPCAIHGICGPNSMCTYHPKDGRSCICAPGHARESLSDWTQGCKPKFSSFCDSKVETEFIKLPHADFYGYEKDLYKNCTLEECKKICLGMCNCLGIRYNDSVCFPKLKLLNGRHSPSVTGDIYFRVPKSSLSSYKIPKIEYAPLQCPGKEVLLPRTYVKTNRSWAIKILLVFVGATFGMEATLVLIICCLLYRNRPEKDGAHINGYHTGPTGFRRFTYDELKQATWNFSKEIGRGSGGIVFKAVLSDCRVAAVKQLHEANQGENEFLAEVSTLRNLNHMNLIDMWGYCAEGKHRLLIYEFMEHGSLAENLSSPTELDWSKRFEIAVGSARGLAYLHEECLEWVLHCDVKPQNILLDSMYQPKVADFGLSKILKREGLDSSFSRIRGTRGYVAPEWVYNMPITSKVDVYSYGIVLLELVTGRSPIGWLANTEGGDENESKRFTPWVRERTRIGVPMETWMKEIVDPRLTEECDNRKIEVLVAVALQCVDEGRDARPTMSQVVEMLLHYGDEDNMILV